MFVGVAGPGHAGTFTARSQSIQSQLAVTHPIHPITADAYGVAVPNCNASRMQGGHSSNRPY